MLINLIKINTYTHVYYFVLCMASKVSEKLSFRKAAEEPNLPIAAATTLISPQARVDFVFMDNEAQEIRNVSPTSQELPSSSTTSISHSNERSNSLRSIVIQ
ncbi:hypothetical protein ISN45_At02g002340 [Arabidopsis thaliana x Arabidopsis arenosa]|uniref:Uncharacterized protein n=2 Tax=Arabidopsis TaxID=3701 RepID=A0A8T2FWI1_ARASU|nr:hypothetical protein ISN45_At02g002340 [Arabidopsis thaliana x Arabidopsis arenosa]KAG7640377.1 hypothetical protein ISN44_As02g002250 [Arabidopsis suecica]